MSLFRKDKFKVNDEVVAAASIDLSDEADWRRLRTTQSVDTRTSDRPWKWYDEIGEVNYCVGRGGKLAGYAKLTARKINKDGSPGEIMATGPAAQIAARLSSPYGGQRGLIDRFYTLLKVPGSAYLIRCRDADGDVEGYDVIDAAEIHRASLDTVKKPGVVMRITSPAPGASTGDVSMVEIRPEDFLGRIWRPASRYVEVAKSPLNALDTECELLYLLTKDIKGKISSRFALNGILFWPNQLNEVRSGAPNSQPTGQENEMVDANDTIARLIKTMQWNITHSGDANSALPIIASGDAQYGEKIQHIIMDQALAETDMKLRAELVERIYSGLDVQRAQATGEGSSNHWNAWNNSDDELKVNIKPDVEMFCWAVTRMILHREMQEMGIAPSTINKYCIWYDLAEAVTAVNAAEDARQARDRIIISEAAARARTGYTEDEAPDDIDRIRAVGLAMDIPQLALYGLEEADKIDWDSIPQTAPTPGPSADTEGDTPRSSPGRGRNGPTPESDTPKRLRPA